MAGRAVMLIAGRGRLAVRAIALGAAVVVVAGCAIGGAGFVAPGGGVGAGVANRIVFTSKPVPSDDPHAPEPANDVYSMDRAGGDILELTSDVSWEAAPTLDPSGLFTAFASNDSAGERKW